VGRKTYTKQGLGISISGGIMLPGRLPGKELQPCFPCQFPRQWSGYVKISFNMLATLVLLMVHSWVLCVSS
jgi:hypothetical protein